MSSPPRIRAEGLGRTYHRNGVPVHALREVDLQIGAGEYVALLGPSGSGKSTLMHILGCLDRPTAGSYQLDGADVSGLDVRALATIRNQEVGFVFQAFHLLARCSAVDNVALPLRFAGVPPRERRRRARDLLERVGLADRWEHKPAELSGGQQQRVALARALVNEPRLILADEPTGNLDSRSGSEILSLLEEAHGGERTLLVVTHDETLASRAHRTLRLLDGRVVEDRRNP